MDQLDAHPPASLNALLTPDEAPRLADRVADEPTTVAHVDASEQRRNRAKI